MSKTFWIGPAGTADPSAVETCDYCGAPRDDDDFETDDALQRVCGACVEPQRAEAFLKRQVAVSAAHAQAVWERAQIDGSAARAAESEGASTMTTSAATLTRIGRGGHIAGHDVLITQDGRIVLFADPQQLRTHHVPDYGTSLWELANRPGFRLGWVRMEDDAEILYFYDRDDDNFGYALNVSDPDLSEWGYAPF